jgi:hypothetical protein
MENISDNINNKLIVTIAIQMHSSVFTFDLNYNTSKIFENVRLLCASGGFTMYYETQLNSLKLVRKLRETYARDIGKSTTTFDLLNDEKKGMFLSNITFDKIFGLSFPEPKFMDFISPNFYFEGIHLISIHKGKKLIFPEPERPNDFINLLLLRDLSRLSKFFDKEMPNIQEFSSNYPNPQMFIEEINSLQRNVRLDENMKTIEIEKLKNEITNLRNQFKCSLDKTGKKIIYIKMSFLVELIKKIISKDCIINLLDYSCNPSNDLIPSKQLPNIKYSEKFDIEQGIPNTKFGGKKYRKNSKKRSKSRKNKNNQKQNRTMY